METTKAKDAQDLLDRATKHVVGEMARLEKMVGNVPDTRIIRLKESHVELRAMAGTRMSSAIEEALRFSKMFMVSVGMQFNHLVFTIEPTDEIEQVWEKVKHAEATAR